MRILMLSSSWPLHEGDSRGGFVRELALELASRGISVDVAVPAPPGPVAPDVLAAGGVVVHWLPSRLPIRSRAFHGVGIENNLLRRPLAALSLPPALAAFAAECVVMLPFVDAIVSNWLLPMGAVGAVLASVSGRPHLVIAHSAPPTPALVPPLSNVVRKVVSTARSVACVSDSVRKSVLELVGPAGEGQLEVMPLGVGLRPFVERHRREGDPLRVLFVGRLVHFKGLDILLGALEGLEGFRLSVAGEGPYRAPMEALAGLLGVDATFHGAVPPEEVRRLMSLSDLLVVPSRRGIFGRQEGMPRVVGEAWSVGLPVLASRSGGMTEAITAGGAGRLFNPGDAGELRSVLVELAGDPVALDAMRVLALAAAGALSWEATGARWAAWVESALNGRA